MKENLYPTIKRILEILWVNDDLIFQEDLEKLQVEAPKLVGERDNYEGVFTLREMVKRADDTIDQEDLCKMQDTAAELAILIANGENQLDDLAASFPWLFTIDFLTEKKGE